MSGQLIRFLFLGFLPLLFFVLLAWSYLEGHPPRWRALAETVLPPLVFTRPLGDRSIYPPREAGRLFLRLCFTLGLFLFGVWTALDILGPGLHETPWVLSGIAAGVAMNAALCLLLNGFERHLVGGGQKEDRSYHWIMKETGTHQRMATAEEVYEHGHGEGSWRTRQTGRSNFVFVLRALAWFTSAALPAAALLSLGVSRSSCTVAVAATLIAGLIVSVKLARA